MPFNEMYNQNYLFVCQLANKIVRDRETSKDISQEVFLKLHSALNEKMQIQNIKSWLYRVTVNHSFNHLRSAKNIGTSVEGFQVAVEPELEFTGSELDEVQKIHEAMIQLKEHEQLILTLYSEGMSYKEIAEISKIPFVSVGKTLSRALSKLKTMCHE